MRDTPARGLLRASSGRGLPSFDLVRASRTHPESPGSGSPHRSDGRPPQTPRGERRSGRGGRSGAEGPFPEGPTRIPPLAPALRPYGPRPGAHTRRPRGPARPPHRRLFFRTLTSASPSARRPSLHQDGGGTAAGRAEPPKGPVISTRAYATWSALDTAHRVGRGALSAVDAVDAALAPIGQRGPGIGAFTEVRAERARARAAEADGRIAPGRAAAARGCADRGEGRGGPRVLPAHPPGGGRVRAGRRHRGAAHRPGWQTYGHTDRGPTPDPLDPTWSPAGSSAEPSRCRTAPCPDDNCGRPQRGRRKKTQPRPAAPRGPSGARKRPRLCACAPSLAPFPCPPAPRGILARETRKPCFRKSFSAVRNGSSAPDPRDCSARNRPIAVRSPHSCAPVIAMAAPGGTATSPRPAR